MSTELVECFKCGGMFPRLPGVATTLNIPVAHVHAGDAGSVEKQGEPCQVVGIERARKLYHLGQAAIFAAVDLWSSELVEDVPLPAEDDPHPPELVAGLDGRTRHEGMRW